MFNIRKDFQMGKCFIKIHGVHVNVINSNWNFKVCYCNINISIISKGKNVTIFGEKRKRWEENCNDLQ